MTINKKELRNMLTGFAFLAPNVIGFMAFTMMPVVVSFGLAFMEWDIIGDPVFIGLNNFITLFQDRNFWYYLYNTVYLMLGIPLGMAFSLFLAILVNNKLRGIVFFRTIYFMPVISSMVAISLLWRWVYNPDFGILNNFLRDIGVINPPRWLSSLGWAKPSLIIMSVWSGAGHNMILYLAALQGVPQELYESASIDGATKWEQFRHITFPMLSFVNFFIVIMGIIGGFQAFGVQYIMTEGGPAGSTTTIVYYIYNNAYKWFKMGYASSIAWVLFIMMFVFTLIQWRLGKKSGEYY
ncbi:MAG: sugar transporter [Elusimicrobia bacterium RIFOXYA2_FULL_40_6]|nr:MAG: sugar transporter [Elusimicrobia bacterium RIFOXYA2_FULL_40_6]